MTSKFMTILALLLPFMCQSQHNYEFNIDSLKTALNNDIPDTSRLANLFDLSEAYYYYHDDSMEVALSHSEECIALATRINDLRWLGSCQNVKGRILTRLERLEESLEANRAGMQAYLDYGDTMKYMMLYDNLGYSLADMGRYDEALEIKKEACEYFKQYSDSSTIGASLYGVAWIYMEKMEYEKALPIFHESMAYCPNWGLLLGEISGSLVQIHTDMNNPDSVSYYYGQANKYLSTIPSSLMLNDHAYALAKEQFGELDSALYYAKLSIGRGGADLEGEEYNVFKATYAKYLALNGRLRQAKSEYKAAEPYVQETANLKHKEMLYQAKLAIEEEGNEYQYALTTYKDLQAVKDERKQEKIEKNFQEIETKYETEKKDREIESLGLKDELNKARLSGRNKWISALGAGLLGLIFFLWRINAKNKTITQQKNDLSKALADKNILLKEIHHRVKNNLQVISSLLALQSNFVKDKAVQEALNVGKSRVHSMSLLHKKLYTNSDLKSVNIKTYFEELITSLMSTYQIEQGKVSFTTDVDELDMDIDTIVPLGLIINELISNTLKHAFTDQEKGEVHLSVKQQGKDIKIKISDNGKGIPFTEIPEQTKSLGLQLIRAFTEKLDGELTIENDQGTTFMIEFEYEG